MGHEMTRGSGSLIAVLQEEEIVFPGVPRTGANCQRWNLLFRARRWRRARNSKLAWILALCQLQVLLWNKSIPSDVDVSACATAVRSEESIQGLPIYRRCSRSSHQSHHGFGALFLHV